MNHTLEAILNQRRASRGASTSQINALVHTDLSQSPPKPDPKGLIAYSGERSIADSFETAANQKLYFKAETILAGVAGLIFLAIALALPLYAYFQ
jgi:hypothetical protein